MYVSYSICLTVIENFVMQDAAFVSHVAERSVCCDIDNLLVSVEVFGG